MKLLPFAFLSTILFGQASLNPAKLLQLPTDSWPTYNGDYSGRRYSPLRRISAQNIDSLSLAWVYRGNAGTEQAGGGHNINVLIKGTPLEINGILYLTAPDHV